MWRTIRCCGGKTLTRKVEISSKMQKDVGLDSNRMHNMI
jgi:hypothetical protein